MSPSCFPAALAVHRLVPTSGGEARDPEVRAREVLRRSKRAHAREVQPRPGAIERVLIDHHQVLDPLAHQAEGGAEPALAAADDQHVEDRLPRLRPARCEPLHAPGSSGARGRAAHVQPGDLVGSCGFVRFRGARSALRGHAGAAGPRRRGDAVQPCRGRRATSSAAMLIAISSGPTAPRSRPTGA